MLYRPMIALKYNSRHCITLLSICQEHLERRHRLFYYHLLDMWISFRHQNPSLTTTKNLLPFNSCFKFRIYTLVLELWIGEKDRYIKRASTCGVNNYVSVLGNYSLLPMSVINYHPVGVLLTEDQVASIRRLLQFH